MTAKKVGPTIDEAIATLQSLLTDIEELLGMLPPGTYLVRGAGMSAQDAARQLKERVKREYKRPAAERSRSIVDADFYKPCIRDVFVALQAFRVNTSPGPEWSSALYNAELSLRHWIAQLKSFKGRS